MGGSSTGRSFLAQQDVFLLAGWADILKTKRTYKAPIARSSGLPNYVSRPPEWLRDIELLWVVLRDSNTYVLRSIFGVS